MSEAVILELIRTITALLTLLIGGYISIKINKLTHHINSRMDELIVESKKSSKAEGKVEEAAEEKERRSQ